MKQPVTVAQNACQRMSRADVAAFFGRSLPWLDKTVKAKRIIPPIRIGGAPFWLRKDLEAFIENLSQQSLKKMGILKGRSKKNKDRQVKNSEILG